MNIFSFSDKEQFNELRTKSMRAYWEAWDCLPDTEGMNVEIKLGDIILHLCTPDSYPDETMKKEKKYGYIIGNHVYLWTKFIDNKYMVNELALGHELLHYLDFNYDLISNPDEWKGDNI